MYTLDLTNFFQASVIWPSKFNLLRLPSLEILTTIVRLIKQKKLSRLHVTVSLCIQTIFVQPIK